MRRFQGISSAGPVAFALSLLFSSTALSASAAQTQQPGHGDLVTVDNPSGGQFVYGPLSGQTSKADALVYMLHLTHTHFGDKPLVGKLLQSRDGNSLATFFTLTAKTMRGQAIAGLVIISAQGKGDPQAAVLYDNAANFINSEPSMMKALTTAWQGSLGGSSNAPNAPASPAAHSSSPAQLYPATAGDRSAMIKMPQGWRITAVSGGQLVAEGDRGEMISMGMIYQNIINPQSQMGQRMISGPMASRGPKVICPLSSNLFADYVCVVNQVRANNGKPQGTFNLTSSQPQPGTGGVRPILACFTVDFQDGQGPRDGSARIDFMTPPNPASGLWAIGVSASNIPRKFGTLTDPTLKAVVESYSQDAAVIHREGAADLTRIQQQGAANRAQADAINQRREAGTQAYDAHMGQLKQNDAAIDQHNANIDWQSKINQDYILDSSVIRDTADTVHATTGNNLADALVKSNPGKLEYVPNQQLVQGVDY